MCRCGAELGFGTTRALLAANTRTHAGNSGVNVVNGQHRAPMSDATLHSPPILL